MCVYLQRKQNTESHENSHTKGRKSLDGQSGKGLSKGRVPVRQDNSDLQERHFDVKLSEKVNATLRRFVKETVLWETVELVSNTDEMRDLLSISSRMY